MDRFQRKRSKEKMEGKADSKESIQLPHLAARRSLDKERIESKSCSSLPSARPSTGLSASTGSPGLGESRRGLGVDLFDEISDVVESAASVDAREKSPSPSVVPTESRPMSRPVPPDHLLSLMKKEAKQEAREPKMSKDRPNSKSRRKTRRSGPVEKQFRRLHEGQKIFDLYYWEEILQQEGDGGKVVVCRPKNGLEDSDFKSFKYVMKIKSKEELRKDKHEEQFVRAQSRLLNLKAPPGVIQLQEVLEDDNFYYVVMDRATGGSFFSCLLQEHQDGTMPPSAVCQVAKDILRTLSILHGEGILHRDIKPDNLVMHNGQVTLIDFDHADADFDSSTGLDRGQHCFGTARFNAPEAFLGCYAAATDLYSVGVIIYLLLTGSLPYPAEIFDDRNPASPAANRRWMQKVVADMEAHRVDWSHPTFSNLPNSRDFCQKLLAFDLMDRIATADQALQHPWLVE